MYRRSLENLQTEYIDYYLLHSIGDEDTFNRRFKDNGVIDFLLKEREAGRIRNLGFSFHGAKEGFDELLALHDKYHWDFIQIQLNWLDWTHAGRRNTDAKYLQEELDKRGIQSVIMEPLLGGRLSKVPDHVADRLKEIDADMLKYVIDSIKVSPNPVSNTRSYMLTALYNAPVTYQTHLDMTVRHDMHAREFGSWDNSFPAV